MTASAATSLQRRAECIGPDLCRELCALAVHIDLLKRKHV